MTSNSCGLCHRLGWLLIVVVAMTLSAGPLVFAQGQGGQGSLTGTVVDAQGAVVPNATILLKDNETGDVLKTTTNQSGVYNFPVVDVGNYNVTASKTGFATHTVTGLLLNASQQANLNITLTVGKARQQVTVNASAQQIRPVNGTLSSLIDRRRITNLPLEDRNPASLVLLSAGTINAGETAAGQIQGLTTYPGEQTALVNGGRQGTTYYMLDGTNNMDSYLNLTNPFPNPEAIQQFQVLLNNFDAQYGFSAGAVVSIASRTGTNKWHGNAFEFLRNDALNARSFFSPTTDTLKRHQFGGSLGGPIKHNKLFVFGNYQRTNADIALLGRQFLTVNNAHRNGDFSDWRQSGDNEPINLATGLPYPGDQIPVSDFSPVALGLLPGLPGTDNANGLFFGGGGRDIYHENQFMTRGDWTISDSQRMFVRYFYTHQPRPFRFADGNLLNQNSSWDSKYWNIAGNHTWMISPTLVNSFTFSWNKTNSYAIHPLTLPDGKQVNMCILGSNMTCNDKYPPMINDFYFGWDIGGDLNENYRRNYTISENVNWIKGKHLIVAGVDVLGEHSQLGSDWGSNPFVWGGNYYATMNADANFLLGYAYQFVQGAGGFNLTDSREIDAYVNDTYKLKPNLTLSMGVRWEPFVGPNFGGNKMADWIPGYQSTRFPLAPVGLAYIGDPGVPKHGFNSKYWSFSPRFGVSWQPESMKHTFVRAAVGLFHGPLAHRLFENTVVGPFDPQISETADDPNNASTGYISLADPYANFPGGNAFPTQDSFACYTCVGSASTPFVVPSSVVAIFDPNLKQPSTLSWNTSIERNFRSEIMIRAAYVGSHSYNQPLVRDLNYATNNVRPNKLYAAIDPTMSIVYSNYHSLQFTFDKKFTSNLQLESNFTWQIINKDIDSIGNTFAARLNDPRSIAANYANSDQYLPYSMVTNFIYMLPIPGSWAANKFVKTTLGGWEAAGIWTWQSGIPFTVYWSGNRSGTLNGYDRASLTSTPAVYNNGNTTRQFLNVSAFMANAVGTYGTSMRNAYSMPDIDNIDFGFYKNFPFGEQRNLQIRFAGFNLFNHATLGTNRTTANAANFGLLNYQRNSPRILQLGAKISF